MGDGADNCENTSNPNQADLDTDDIGDACDPDIDGDTLPNGQETGCPTSTNPNNADSDNDGTSDDADAFPCNPNENEDTDDDGVGDNGDNCVDDDNPNQDNLDNDALGDACDPDIDGDTLRERRRDRLPGDLGAR